MGLEALLRRRVEEYFAGATRRLKRSEARLAGVGAASQVPLRVRLLWKTAWFQQVGGGVGGVLRAAPTGVAPHMVCGGLCVEDRARYREREPGLCVWDRARNRV